MMRADYKSKSRSGQEEGFLLLGVLFMILLVMIALAVAAPKIADSIRRDKEEETIQRGKQYARAVRMYYNKFGRYPNTIDQLIKTNDQRFLRKRYLDPMTGKDDWRIIHNGEQKVPALGLFGQAVQQQNGITPTGASTTTGTAGSIGSSPPFGSSAGSPGTSTGSSSLGSSGSGFGSSGSSFGSGSSTSPFGNSGSSTSPIGGTDSSSSGGFGSSTGIGGTTTTGAPGTSTTNNIGGVQTTGGSSSAFGSPGVSVGGAPIVGVGLTDKRASIKVYKKQTHYNQWEFVFDQNQMATDALAGGVGAGNINGATATGTTNGTGLNSGTGSGGLGSSSGPGFGSSSGPGFGSSSGSGFGSNSGSGFGSSNGSGSNNGSGFGSPSSPTSPTPPSNNSPQ